MLVKKIVGCRMLVEDAKGMSGYGKSSERPLFQEEIAARYDGWFSSPMGRYVKEVEDALILELLKPRAGESLLDVGCGTGAHLLLFRELGLDVSGVDPSEPMLERARAKLGNSADLKVARAEDLPFDDDSFDIVTLITSLEFAHPSKALSEAFRVAKSRVFVGVLNGFSANGIQRRVESLFRPTIYRHARFYSVWELKALVWRLLGPSRIDWASVIWLPLRLYWLDRRLNRWIPRRFNPFGAFLGMRIDIRYTRKIVLQPLATGWEGKRPVNPSCCPLTCGKGLER